MTPEQYKNIVKSAFTLPMYPDEVQEIIRYEMEEHEKRIDRNYLHGERQPLRHRSAPEVYAGTQQSGSRQKINLWLLQNPAHNVFSGLPLIELGVPRSTIRDHFRRLLDAEIITEHFMKGYNGYKQYTMNPYQHNKLKEWCGLET